MPEESRTRRLAILIDADNTSPRIAAGLFEEVAKFGEASVLRIYGDFSGQRLKAWADILQKYAIDPYQQFAYNSRSGPLLSAASRRTISDGRGSRASPSGSCDGAG